MPSKRPAEETKQAVKQKIARMTQDLLDEDVPDPRKMVTDAIVRHNVDGKRMLELAARGKTGAREMAALCSGYTQLPAACQELLTDMCQTLLERFQQDSKTFKAKAKGGGVGV